MNKTYKVPSHKVSLYSQKFKRQSKSPYKLSTSRDWTTLNEDNIFQKVCCPNCRYLFKVITNQNLSTSRKNYERYYKEVRQEATQTLDTKNPSSSFSPLQSQSRIYTNPSQSRVNKNKDGSYRKNSSIYDLQNQKRNQPSNSIKKEARLFDRSNKKSLTPKSGLKNLNLTPKKSNISQINKITNEVHSQNPKSIDKNSEKQFDKKQEYIKQMLYKNNLQIQNRQLKMVLKQLGADHVLPGFCKMLLSDKSAENIITR